MVKISLSYQVVPILILLIRIFLCSAAGSGNLNNLKADPYDYLFAASFNHNFLYLILGGKVSLYFGSRENIYVVSICSFNQKDYGYFINV